jgi:hypothetical protein
MSNRNDVVTANATKKEVAKIRVSEEAIIRSCLLGDTALLKRWGKQGIRVASAGPALSMALRGEPQDLDVLRCLVTYLGADVNQFNEDGMTPLVLATELEHLHVLRFLVEELGADINQNSGPRENNALWLAASNGKLNVVRCLVKLGADINQRSEGMTPLQSAAYSKEFVVVKWLVKAGADPRAKLGPSTELYAESNKGPEKGEAESLDAMAAVSDALNLTAVEMSKSASAEQFAYIQAKSHCSSPNCSGAGLLKCTGCRRARYCGEKCQLIHWKAHKADCRRWSTECAADDSVGSPRI